MYYIVSHHSSQRNIRSHLHCIFPDPLVGFDLISSLHRDLILARRRANRQKTPPKFLLTVSSMVFCSTTTYFIVVIIQPLQWFFQLQHVGILESATVDNIFLSLIQNSWPLTIVLSVMRSFNVCNLFTSNHSQLLVLYSSRQETQFWSGELAVSGSNSLSFELFSGFY